MKKILVILFLIPFITNAQITYPFGQAIDSTIFTFSTGDSLTHLLYIHPASGWSSSPDSAIVTIDTTSAMLWQIGKTLKPAFSDGSIQVSGIMTDTLNPYPPNANDFFTINIGYLVPNVIVDFWHKYVTDSLHAGGIVEFSTDSGATWINVANCPYVNTENFYSSTDTVISGQSAFTGTSNGARLSRIQFMNCIHFGIKLTSTGCLWLYNDYDSTYSISLRFRFVSDSTVDTLSGWMIDSIKVENTGCLLVGGGQKFKNENSLAIFPNPVFEELTLQSSGKPIERVDIADILGRVVYTRKLIASSQTLKFDVTELPTGVYLIKVNGTEVRMFIKE